MLIYGFTPTYAAGISIMAVIVASWLTPHKMGFSAIMEALALGARNMVMTGVLLCTVGLIVNVIATTGIGNTFSLMITQWANGSLIIAIALIALALAFFLITPWSNAVHLVAAVIFIAFFIFNLKQTPQENNFA